MRSAFVFGGVGCVRRERRKVLVCGEGDEVGVSLSTASLNGTVQRGKYVASVDATGKDGMQVASLNGTGKGPIEGDVSQKSGTERRRQERRGKGGDVWYFAYGSNMYPQVFGPHATNPTRKMAFKKATRGKLMDYEMVFNTPAVPILEPTMANVVEKEGAETHGVAFQLSAANFRRLSASEGFPRVIQIKIADDLGNEIDAKTFQFRSFKGGFVGAPSARYMSMLLAGARYWDLPRSYQDSLRATRPSSFFTKPLFDVSNAGLGRSHGLFSPHEMLKREQETVVAEEHWRRGKVRLIPLQQIGGTEADEKAAKNEAEGGKERDLLVYFPGIDGTGTGLVSHVSALVDKFEPYGMVVPVTDRSDWDALCDLSIKAIEKLLKQKNRSQVVLVCESMGGVMGLLAIHKRPDLFKHMLAINPASAYSDSFTAQMYEGFGLNVLPPQVYSLIPYLSIPILIDPNKFVPTLVSSPERAFHMLGSLLGVGKLSDILQPDVLKHRLSMMKENPISSALLQDISVPVTIVASQNDLLLPSLKESERLVRFIPNSTRFVLDGGGHTPLLSIAPKKLQLGRILQRAMEKQANMNGTSTRDGSTGPLPPPRSSSVGFECSEFLPPSQETIEAAELRMSFIKRFHSPVFVGLDRVPVENDRAVLFVVNHTLYGLLDAPFLIDHFVTKRNVLLRGLAHPMLWNATERMKILGSPNVDIRAIIQNFGALPVTPRNMYRLLKAKESVLLFPGGARETCKTKKDDKYGLLWEQSTDFVRMALRTNALIVPVGCVGPNDCYNIVIDTDEIISTPVIGDEIKRRVAELYKSLGTRRWKTDVPIEEVARGVLQPLAVPTTPERVYFYFGEVIDPTLNAPSKEDVDGEKQHCASVYAQVRAGVEDAISTLIERREDDPYRQASSRLPYEQARDAKAPTAWKWSNSETYFDDEDF